MSQLTVNAPGYEWWKKRWFWGSLAYIHPCNKLFWSFPLCCYWKTIFSIRVRMATKSTALLFISSLKRRFIVSVELFLNLFVGSPKQAAKRHDRIIKIFNVSFKEWTPPLTSSIHCAKGVGQYFLILLNFDSYSRYLILLNLFRRI